MIINKKIITLDSDNNNLNNLSKNLTDIYLEMKKQSDDIKKSLNQLKINNMYNSHRDEFIIDDNIFDTK